MYALPFLLPAVEGRKGFTKQILRPGFTAPRDSDPNGGRTFLAAAPAITKA